jgi:phenylpropionate dioxygenase-like ring-hydroxylating dioxygenase large terminal subunit
MFLNNCWYVAAWSHELPDDGFLARRILDEPLLFYRTSSGEAVGLADRCCHRHAPLSLGRREGDDIRCMYHGLRFAPTGRCVEIPGVEGRIPAKVGVRRYPVTVRNKWVFVWMGDPARADERLLPDNFSCDHPDWRNLPGYLHYETPYELICDNLLDFSHLSYVHEKTLGGSPEIAQSRPTVEDIPRGVRVARHIRNVPAPPYYQTLRDLKDVRVDRWFKYDFILPGTLLMESGGRPVDDDAGDDRRVVRLHSCQTLTPETDSTTHYFFQQSHRKELGDAGTTRLLFEQLLVAFDEDKRMITAQSRNLSPHEPMTTLWMDAALVKFRRLLEQLIRRERETPGNTVSMN